MSYKAIIFDYIGTLVNCKGYRLDASRKTLYNALVNQGFDMPEDRFMAAYDSAHLKYRKIRYEQFKEVTNAVWVSEALSNFYNKIAPDDSRIKEALNMFFQEFVNTFELRSGAKELLQQTAGKVKVCLISNFTYAPVIHSSLRKIGIDQYFNLIVISDDIGWRKPSPKIFQYALNRLQVKACEAIFIGDSPIEDIEGAQNSGLKAIFVPSQFNSLKDLENCKQKPNYTTKDLNTLINDLNRFLTQTN